MTFTVKISIILLTILTFLIVVTFREKLVTKGSILIFTAVLSTVLVSVLTGSWYAFILFLIFITGILVLFGYFLAIRPNNHHSDKKYFKSFLPIVGLILYIWIPNSINLPSYKLRFESDVLSIISRLNIPLY